jgi:hypothetical protein
VTPAARSLALLRRSGYRADVVQKWNAHAGVSVDLFGFGDVFAVSDRREPPRVIVQATTLDHVAHRLAKARARPELGVCLRAGIVFWVHGWYRRAGRWEVKVVEVRAEDLAGVVVQAPPRRRRRPVQAGLFDGMG